MGKILRVVLIVVLAAVAAAAGERVEAPPERAFSAFGSDPARQFDFWIGRWRVNLRMQQPDLSFRDSVTAESHVYPILDGKAILELWDSEPIKGYSLRTWDPAKRRWVLWLDWPSRNNSGIASLEGEFRHGRGEFYARSTDAQGQERVERYSFNDITPFSLRWDDLYSSDGGRTWRKNWVMEFSRLAVDPQWPIAPDDVPTFVDGSRCDAEPFRPHEAIVGSWRGDGARLDAFRILDGCAVMAFLTTGESSEFLFLTWVSRDQRWETDVLDQRPNSGLRRYTGAADWTRLETEDGAVLTWSVEADRLVYRRGTAESVLVRVEP